MYFEDLLDCDNNLAHYLKNHPEKALREATEAFKNVLAIDSGGVIDYEIHYDVRITTANNSNEIKLRNLRSENLDRLCYVRGTVVRLAPPKPQLITGRFECPLCQAVNIIPQTMEGSTLQIPEACSNPNCQNKKGFKLVSELSEYIDYQKISIQEPPEDLTPGTIPRILPAIMRYGLVDAVRPGDRVKINGIYRSVPTENNRGKASAIGNPYIEVNNIDGMKQEDEEVDISQDDMTRILQLAQEPDIQKKIARSIAPTIYGHDHLKLAACFSIFGGVPKKKKGGTKIRGDIHVLFMGDPGTGKSQILQFCSKLLSRSVYTSGKGASAAGLTAAVVKESDKEGMALEAGALVLASGGLAAIDEFDKMKDADRVAIHEALEQQTVSVAKAGIIATLQSKTAVIAAANPKFGRYNEFKTPTENINLSPPILSRFDLLFIVKDKPDVELDEKIFDYISNQDDSEYNELDGTEQNVIPVELLKKYILHARNSCKPQLSAEAIAAIKKYYLGLRNASKGQEGISIVARYAEGLIRMAEAYAKMGLHDTVTEQDALESISMMDRSMKEIGLDPETGRIDVDRVQSDKPATKRQKLEELRTILERMQKQRMDNEVLIKDFIQQAKNEGHTLDSVEDGMRILKAQGDTYNPKNTTIKLCRSVI